MSTDLRKALGNELCQKVHDANILIVGAGGIGCELLKNVALSGFKNVHIIDMDTIEVSNLNRQFLFRSCHVAKPKAIIARESVLQFNPDMNITADHKNIKSEEFGSSFFKQFSIVFNALDNIDARKHVNRLCLSADVPLIESGSAGYLGQVSVVKKGETECYECTPKIKPKKYPICTIRSTPDKMVHCIVWAKECYKLLFGTMDESMIWEDPSNEEVSMFMPLIFRPSDMRLDDFGVCQSYAQNVFKGLFEFEVNKKLDMGLYKSVTKQPSPLILEDIVPMSTMEASVLALVEDSTKTFDKMSVWSLSQCVERFYASIIRMLHKEDARKHLGSYEFDKDDPLAMEFVTAAANLRAAVFNIPFESYFNCMGIAGNIIPAIATTNAIIAGLQVLEAYRILEAKQPISEACNYIYCNATEDSRGVLINPVKLSTPNPECYVCNRSIIKVHIDTEKTLFSDFISKVLKEKLGVHEPTISIGSNTIYEEGENSEAGLLVNLTKKLSKLPNNGIRNDTIVSIEDYLQDFQCHLHIFHRNESDFEKDSTEFFILGDIATESDFSDVDFEVEDDQSATLHKNIAKVKVTLPRKRNLNEI